MLRVLCRKFSSNSDIKCNTIFALVSHVSDRGSPVAIIRVSGSSVPQVVQALTRKQPEARKATLCKIRDPQSSLAVDNGIVLSYPKPNSYTGEHVAEFMVHGSKAVISKILRIMAEFPGLRPAEPGEFTKRALLNNKLDLTEAEAIKELIESRTEVQRKRALEGVSGETSLRYSSWRQQLVKCLADVEAQIDFGEDEGIDMTSLNQSIQSIRDLRNTIKKYCSESKRKSSIAKNGFQVVIMGEPNVGKSSLINRLAARDVSIVSKVEGTTRDVIEVVLDLKGHLVTLYDTAGLRELPVRQQQEEDNDSIEEEGMKRARIKGQSADLILFLVDASRPSSVELEGLLKEKTGQTVLKVVNKIDLMKDPAFQEKRAETLNDADCFISCKNNDGIEELEEKIMDEINSVYSVIEQGFMTERQESHLNQVSSSLTTALNVIDCKESDFVVVAHHLRRAAKGLASLTEKDITSEDVLDVIFRDFCIGK